MILTRDKIFEEMDAGRIEIDPFDPETVGPASIDFHLAEEFRFLRQSSEAIDVHDDTDYRDHSDFIEVNDSLVIEPGQTVLGLTRERIRLASNLCGWLEGRSRFARLGLTVHVTAGFISPGINNKQVLEISNVSGCALRVFPGTRICQIIVQRTDGTATYDGRFREQETV